MGENKVLEPARWGSTEADTVIAPISFDAVKATLMPNGKKLMWWYIRRLGFGYNPYLVRIVNRIDSDNIRIQFVNHETGDPVGGEHDINLEDKDLVHRDPPSSLIPAAIDPLKPVVVLMLNHQEMNQSLLADAMLSNAWPELTPLLAGKWPETAWDVLVKLAAKLQAELGHKKFIEALVEALLHVPQGRSAEE